MKIQKRYKFLREGMKSEYGDFTWEINKWYKHEGKVKLCNGGFHCSKEIGQAFSYVQGEILAEVEVRGKCDEGNDKDSWEEMKIVKVWNWEKKNSVAISIFSAELCLKNYEDVYPEEKAPRLAIEAAKNWLANPTPENESAAWYAAESAWSAARSASWSSWSSWYAAESAWSAARSAARSAESAESAESAGSAGSAWSAARSAARSAESAWSAGSAAESAALKQIYKRFDEELNNLTKYDR